MLSRRYIMGVLAGVTWLAGRPPSFAPWPSAYENLGAFCADLPCSAELSQACLRSLGVNKPNSRQFASLILAELSLTDWEFSSAVALRDSIRKQSQDDFASGNIISVEGWMLSLTETRVYALAGMIANTRG